MTWTPESESTCAFAGEPTKATAAVATQQRVIHTTAMQCLLVPTRAPPQLASNSPPIALSCGCPVRATHHECFRSPSSNAGSSVPFRCHCVNILHRTNCHEARD
jgi:hypothetical protein